MHDYWLAILIGVVEGVTEFLPISSTGHMLIVQHALGVDLDDGFWKLFTIVIQLGAILSVVLYYWRRLVELVGSFVRRPTWRHPLILVGLAFVPSGVVGMLAKKHVDALMEHLLPIAAALIVGAILIELIERYTAGKARTERLEDVTPRQALGIGIGQVFSLVPGVSRSAATIMGGLLGGVNRTTAADFSFLLSIPTMFAASAYSLFKHIRDPNTAPLTLDRWLVLGTGFATAFVVALVVVAWFLRYIQTHTFRLFNIYRIVLGVGIIAAVGLS